MPNFNLNLPATMQARTPEEAARLDETSKIKCPVCNKPMTVGDEEAAGICGSCYWDKLQGDDNA